MRLTPHEVRIIRETTREVFGPDASVRLFGSRTDDQARGGDIDLLVESEAPIADRFHKELELGAKLQMRLGGSTDRHPGDRPRCPVTADSPAGATYRDRTMNTNEPLFSPEERLLQTLTLLYREGQHLQFSHQRLASQMIDAAWAWRLEQDPMLAVEVDAFASRFGRMQDTIGEKLLPRWLTALEETPGSLIEVLNRAERLGVVTSASDWISIRRLRNKLIHEYMQDPAQLAQALVDALMAVPMLFETYNRVRAYSMANLNLDSLALPGPLSVD